MNTEILLKSFAEARNGDTFAVLRALSIINSGSSKFSACIVVDDAENNLRKVDFYDPDDDNEPHLIITRSHDWVMYHLEGFDPVDGLNIEDTFEDTSICLKKRTVFFDFSSYLIACINLVWLHGGEVTYKDV